MRAHSTLKLSALLLTLSAGALGFHLSEFHRSISQSPIVTESTASRIELIPLHDDPASGQLSDQASNVDVIGTSVENAESQLLVQEPSQRRSRKPALGNVLANSNQRGSYKMLQSFRSAIGDNWKATVDLIVEKKRVAMGAIVRADGWIVTKASQMPAHTEILCSFYDGTEARAELVAQNSELDLALLHVDDDQLPVVTWADESLPSRGRWVATTDTKETPAAVGVVSAGIQKIDQRRTVLGVELDPTERGGALVTKVLRGAGADVAGLKVGDVITAIDSETLANRDAVFAKLKTFTAGQSILLGITRGDSKFDTAAQLMDLAAELHDPTEMEVNGPISARSTGFKSVFMHDTVLHPTQCGGPLVDLEGRVVGINIARAGRVTSYALPASVVRPEIDHMISDAQQKAKSNTPIGASVISTTVK
ncbi:MAG: PDZ domain-containing protein [Pirellulales bacterium]